MPSFAVRTPHRTYTAVVERGAVSHLGKHIPDTAGRLFLVTTDDVWQLHGGRIRQVLGGREPEVLLFPGGEERKRLSEVEALADQMVIRGGDRSSLVIAFGGGIVNDLGGFLAAGFMRGIPVIQIPTTLLAQVDAGVGGKTGVNLLSGKNLFGAFHQPLAVLIDPDLLCTLPEREYRAGLYEVLKTGLIRSEPLFRRMIDQRDRVLAMEPDVVEEIVAQSVAIKADVVSADEKESDLRRILNFGHTLGHALEAETSFARLLHGEDVAFGMRAATHLAVMHGTLDSATGDEIIDAVKQYGPIPPLDGISAEAVADRVKSDKKTIRGAVHFVLPTRIGEVTVVSGIDESKILAATRRALDETAA